MDFRASVVTAGVACYSIARMRPAAPGVPEGRNGLPDVAPRLASQSANQ